MPPEEQLEDGSKNETFIKKASLHSLLNPIQARIAPRATADIEGDSLVQDAIAGLLRGGGGDDDHQHHLLCSTTLRDTDESTSDSTLSTESLTMGGPNLPSIHTLLRIAKPAPRSPLSERPPGRINNRAASELVNLTRRYFNKSPESSATSSAVPRIANRSQTKYLEIPRTLQPLMPSGSVPDASKLLRKCTNCGTQDTPSWRRCGPESILLCNACGLYYNEHRRHRPFRVGQDGRTKALRIRSKGIRPCVRCGTDSGGSTTAQPQALCHICNLYIEETRHGRPNHDREQSNFTQ